MGVISISFKVFIKKYLGPDNYIASIISLLTGILVTVIFNNKTIPFYIFAGYVLISSFFIWYLLLKVYFKNDEPNDIIQFNIISIQKRNDNKLICMLHQSNILSIGAFITLYRYDNNFESYFATARVINIQSNKIIQCEIIDIIDSEVEIKNLNDALFLSNIIIKPIITDNVVNL